MTCRSGTLRVLRVFGARGRDSLPAAMGSGSSAGTRCLKVTNLWLPQALLCFLKACSHTEEKQPNKNAAFLQLPDMADKG